MACVGHGRRVHASAQTSTQSVNARSRVEQADAFVSRPAESLVRLLRTFDAAAAFNPSGPALQLPVSKVCVTQSSSSVPRCTRDVSMLAVPPQAVVALALNSGLAAIGQLKGQRVLTTSGLVHAWALGVILWSSLGWTGWSTCVLYLICGSKVTKVKMAKKEALGIAEGRGGMRGPENVWGSAASAAVCALASAQWPAHAAIWRVGFVASLATKLSDTCASEIGKAYGKTTYLITTLKSVPAGTEGAVSLEGTLAGVAGSILLTAYAIATGIVGMSALAPCLLAAFIATNVESLIGASAQGRFNWLTNEVVNFIMTVIGAAAGIALTGVLR